MPNTSTATTAPGAEFECVKGAPIREFIRWWERHRDPHGLRAATEAVTERDPSGRLRADQEALGILPSAWYPATFVHQLLDSMLQDLSISEQRSIADTAGRACMHNILRGVYRALFSMFATPDRYHQYAQRFWNMHYGSGLVSSEAPEPRERVLIIREWASHHRFICLLNVSGTQALYEAMGCSNPRATSDACISDGAQECRIHIRW